MRIIIVSMLFVGMLYANTTIELKKGWQLVGVPTTLSNMSIFNNKSVEVVWGFDGATQQWRGYSPDANISAAIDKNALQRLETLEPWQAVWVFSSSDWKMTLDTATLPSTAQNSTMHLYKGWNLVEIPQQSVVSENFFGDAVVWKYSSDQQWKVNDATLNFPSIEAITASEGLWVKSETDRTIDIENRLSALQTFESEASMLAYIRKMLQMQNYYPYVVLETPPELATSDTGSVLSGTVQEDASSAQNMTTTNLQEVGVDEGDILKHNTEYLFSADNSHGRIIVTSFSRLIAKEYKPLSTIDMSGKSIIAMYLHENRLAVLSNTAYYYINDVTEESQRTSVLYDPNQSFTLDIFDISDMNNILKVTTHEIEGNYKTSRLINGRLFLVSQFMPNIVYEYPKVYVDTLCSDIYPTEGIVCTASTDNGVGTSTEEPLPPAPRAISDGCNYDIEAWNTHNCSAYQYDETGAWKYDYENPIVQNEHLIPSIKTEGQSRTLVAPSTLYAPNKLDQRANITTISSFSMQDGRYHESLSFLGNTNNYYASPTSLYLASSEYPMFFDYTHAKEQQMIYKFALGESLAYEGRGFVEGWMLNQFSMSEKDGYLRVATTVGQSWWNRQTNNSVYTLKEVNETLQVEGVLSGLGKEGETIHAVRFMGDRGFVVTFERTDPLYTLDLSDPKNPKKVGELSIPGFSRYLHVIDANRLLSIGRNADASGRQQELQVQLFDISDFANPRLADKVQIGTKDSYSEAEYNHKAFAYRASDLMFGLPYQNYTYGITKNSSENFGIYQVDGMQIKPIHTITSNGTEWGSVGRGVIFDANEHTYGALIKGANMMCESIK